MLKRSPMPARTKPIARKGKRARQDDVELAEAHIELAYRSHGMCEMPGCTRPFQVKHHVSRRGTTFGVTRNHPANLLALCHWCHTGSPTSIHADEVSARRNGYLI